MTNEEMSQAVEILKVALGDDAEACDKGVLLDLLADHGIERDVDSHPCKVGEYWFFQQVTHNYAGVVKRKYRDKVELWPVWMVNETGPVASLKDAKFKSQEKSPVSVHVHFGATNASIGPLKQSG